MKFLILLFGFLVCRNCTAQQKSFYNEHLLSDQLPEGWYLPKVDNWSPQWIVSNQPYPGSYKYQQQAPPIASASRGFHLQFNAGYFTDEDVDNWVKEKRYPDGYIISRAIDCSKHSSVILKFQQTFRWWNYKIADTAGLFVGISSDSIHWKEWDVRHDVISGTDMITPLKEEINISKWAANQPRVFIRFYWKGIEGWYWMIDDISLTEAFQKDIGITRLISQNESGNQFKKRDSLTINVKNFGIEPIKSPITINATLDGKALQPITLETAKDPFGAGEEKLVEFSNIDLNNTPLHKVSFNVHVDGDENSLNDTLHKTISQDSSSLGSVDSWHKIDNGIELVSGVSKLKVIFYKRNVFRIWLAPDGDYTNPTDTTIVVNYKFDNVPLLITSDTKNIYLKTSSCKIVIRKDQILFSLFNHSNTLIFKETQPLTFGTKTTQYLSRGEHEFFYGCGMQNGYFSHRNQIIKIEKGGGWDDGGRANPTPFFMSTNGYGSLRNTFDVGLYDFTEKMHLSHNENRFDCFYFVDDSLKAILNDYTQISGRPFMPARWQLSLGDANCYNKPGRNKETQTTPDVIWKVADEYIKNNMPHGWILPNDGYGCGYVKLDSTVKELHKRGFYTGLWTENGVDKIATEVGQFGTRVCKLDVAWVGPGYKYALDGCRAAYNGIENNSDSRGFVWSVMGWAGTQRYSVVWSGDQKGNWEYIRFHIPTIIGSGLSAFNCATGDVDGIFGGSDSTYVRDLQWKCFTPVFMVMSGWAKKDKQPYIYGEPYTSINRKYLQLKMRLTPYMYTLMHEAYTTGVPAVRALVLENQNDPVTWNTSTQYQFLLGQSILVAPVWKPESKRDSIYLPRGNWIDYWDAKVYQGNRWLNNYNTPLDKLPLFIKAGAIIPMYPRMNYDGERPLDTLTLDIYPHGNSAYKLYEDDGNTRAYKNNEFATTNINCIQKVGSTVISIDGIKGSYANMLKQRNYVLQIHLAKEPTSISINNKKLDVLQYNYSSEKNGLLIIDCGKFDVSEKIEITLKNK